MLVWKTFTSKGGMKRSSGNPDFVGELSIFIFLSSRWNCKLKRIDWSLTPLHISGRRRWWLHCKAEHLNNLWLRISFSVYDKAKSLTISIFVVWFEGLSRYKIWNYYVENLLSNFVSGILIKFSSWKGLRQRSDRTQFPMWQCSSARE